MDTEYEGTIEPPRERFQHGDVVQETVKHSAWASTKISYEKNPFAMDKLKASGDITERDLKTGLMLRDIWHMMGHWSLTPRYEQRSTETGEMSDTRANLWALYNECVRAIPIECRMDVLRICCDDEAGDVENFKIGIKAVQRAFAKLARAHDERMTTYVSVARQLEKKTE
jgi:hypothetical protein